MIEVPVASLRGNYQELLKSLTVNNPEYKNARFFGKGFVKKSIPRKLFFFRLNQKNKSIFLPRGMDSKYFNLDSAKFNLSLGRKIGTGHQPGTIKLRAHQEKYMEEVVYPYITDREANYGEEELDILMNCYCGSGKTFLSEYMASIYGRNTVVCVTIKKIGNQFIQTCKDLFPEWTVGWYDGKTDFDITIGTYALFSQDRFDEKFFSNFGHIILDEFHRAGADTYNAILEKAPCKYRTSLTATFRRKDGLHKILKFHAGKILEMEKNEQMATIYPVRTGTEVNEEVFRGVGRFSIKPDKLAVYSEVAIKCKSTKKELDRGLITGIKGAGADGSILFDIESYISKQKESYDTSDVNVFPLGIISLPMIDTEISEMEERTDIAMELIRQCYKDGRRTVILSKRKEQLYKLSKRLKRYGIPNAVVISEQDADYKKFCADNGKTVAEYREWVNNSSKIILGIDKLAEEGMDVPLFDTLLYLHPVKDIEQSIGRILRPNPEGHTPPKKHPVAFYFLDKVTPYQKAWNAKEGAKKMFIELGHSVKPEQTIDQLKELFEYGKV